MCKKDGTVDGQGTKSRRKFEVPFVRGEFRKTVHDPVAFLGFLGNAFISKVRGWYDPRGSLDDDVAIFAIEDSPLKRPVSDSSSESDVVLPPAWGRVGHWEGEW